MLAVIALVDAVAVAICDSIDTSACNAHMHRCSVLLLLLLINDHYFQSAFSIHNL
jgi:hypothetical protein